MSKKQSNNPNTMEIKVNVKIKKKVLIVGYGVLGKATLNEVMSDCDFMDGVDFYVHDLKNAFSLPKGVKVLDVGEAFTKKFVFDIVVLCIHSHSVEGWIKSLFLQNNGLFKRDEGALVVRSTLPMNFYTDEVKQLWPNFVYFPEFSSEHDMDKDKTQVHFPVFSSNRLADNCWSRLYGSGSIPKPFNEVAATKIFQNAALATKAMFQNEVNSICRDFNIQDLGKKAWLNVEKLQSSNKATPSSMVAGKCLRDSLKAFERIEFNNHFLFSSLAEENEYFINRYLDQVLTHIKRDMRIEVNNARQNNKKNGSEKKTTNVNKTLSLIGLNNNVMYEDSPFDHSPAEHALRLLGHTVKNSDKIKISVSRHCSLKHLEEVTKKYPRIKDTLVSDYVLFLQPMKIRMAAVKEMAAFRTNLQVFDMVDQFTPQNIRELSRSFPGVKIIKKIRMTP